MKKLLSVLCLLSVAAFAGEKYLGTIQTSGASANNLGSGGDAGFYIPVKAKITVQVVNPDGGSGSAYECVNDPTCAATGSHTGVLLTGTQAIPTDVNTTTGTRACANPDAGTMNCPTAPRITAIVSCIAAESNVCNVFQRTGTEFEAK